jgi:RNA polymerase sigma-70 factor (ECF subfamily)
MPTDEQFQQWCRRIAASDREAFEAVFDALHDPLARYALQITGRTAAAQDIVQYAFTSLWDMRESLTPKESLEACFFALCATARTTPNGIAAPVRASTTS